MSSPALPLGGDGSCSLGSSQEANDRSSEDHNHQEVPGDDGMQCLESQTTAKEKPTADQDTRRAFCRQVLQLWSTVTPAEGLHREEEEAVEISYGGGD